MKKINILVVGGTGFIGRNLVPALLEADHGVTVLARRPPPEIPAMHDIDAIQADVTVPGRWQELIPGFDAVINLAGISIFRRWTDQAKYEILHSRLAATRNVVGALRVRRGNVRHYLGVSGVGYYGFHGDEAVDEESPAGTDFLARVAARWEEAVSPVEELGIRPVILRLGHVLGPHGGVLPKLSSLARCHLAGAWGGGDQWLSWVHEKDLAGSVLFLLEDVTVSGPVNVTAPKPVRNREMMRLLAGITGKRVFIPPVPEFLLRLIAGEFASVFVNGQRAVPGKLALRGFNFAYPDLRGALEMLAPALTAPRS